MRNPWNDEFAQAPRARRDHKKPGFSLRTALVLVIGNIATMTAAHALAGFGRGLRADSGNAWLGAIGAQRSEPDRAREIEPLAAAMAPSLDPVFLPRRIVQIHIVEWRGTHAGVRSSTGMDPGTRPALQLTAATFRYREVSQSR